MTKEAPAAQALPHLSARQYHAMLERQSCSMLKWLLKSPAHYRERLTAPAGTSASMAFGSLVHLLVLEPSTLPFEYHVVPQKTRRARTAHTEDSRILITEVELHEARRVADRVLATPVLGRPFFKFVEEGKPELTILFDDPTTSVACRSRIDLWHPDIVFDLKTSRHACPVAFRRSALELHYDMQAYMYSLADALLERREAANPFYFLAAENTAPHVVQVVKAGEPFVRNGQSKYQHAIALYKACSELEHWEPIAHESTLELDPWEAFDPKAAAAGVMA